MINSPIETLENNNQDGNRSSFKLRGRNLDANKTNAATNASMENEIYEKKKVYIYTYIYINFFFIIKSTKCSIYLNKKKYKVHGMENVKDVFKSAIEDDIKNERSVEYESPEEKGNWIILYYIT